MTEVAILPEQLHTISKMEDLPGTGSLIFVSQHSFNMLAVRVTYFGSGPDSWSTVVLDRDGQPVTFATSGSGNSERLFRDLREYMQTADLARFADREVRDGRPA